MNAKLIPTEGGMTRQDRPGYWVRVDQKREDQLLVGVFNDRTQWVTLGVRTGVMAHVAGDQFGFSEVFCVVKGRTVKEVYAPVPDFVVNAKGVK